LELKANPPGSATCVHATTFHARLRTTSRQCRAKRVNLED